MFFCTLPIALRGSSSTTNTRLGILNFASRPSSAPSTPASVTSALGAAVFLFAGLYQFAPIKRACLTHCRTPLRYFLSRWHDGPAGGFRLGVNHGLFCVGCCWALMATSFAVGIMTVWWMAALAAIAVMEQVVPHGHRLRVPLGVGFMIAGVWQYVA